MRSACPDTFQPDQVARINFLRPLRTSGQLGDAIPVFQLLLADSVHNCSGARPRPEMGSIAVTKLLHSVSLEVGNHRIRSVRIPSGTAGPQAATDIVWLTL